MSGINTSEKGKIVKPHELEPEPGGALGGPNWPGSGSATDRIST
jgi:hypothetical protein